MAFQFKTDVKADVTGCDMVNVKSNWVAEDNVAETD